MLARRSLLIFSNNVLGAIFGLVSLFFIGRYLTNEAYGMFGFAFSFVAMATILADLGLDKAHLKRVSEGMDLGRCLTVYAVIKIVLASTVLGGLVVAAAFWDHYKGFTDATTFPVLAVVALYYLFVQLRAIPIQTFNAFRFTAKSQLAALAENLTKAPLLILVALAYGLLRGRWVPFSDAARGVVELVPFITEWSAENAAVAIAVVHVIAVLASLGVALWILVSHRYPFGPFDTDVLRRYVVFALPIAPITLVGILGRRIDTFMIGYFWSSTEVSYYFASERMMTMLLMVPMAVGTLFFPLISELGAQRSMDAINAVAKSTQRMMSILLTPLAMLLIVYTPQIIHIFLSDSYLPAVGALRWLVVYVMAFSYTTVGRNILMGLDHPRLAMQISLVMIVSNLVLNTALIPPSIFGVPLGAMGAEGAALSTAASQIAGSLMAMLAARRLTGSYQFGTDVGKHIAVAIIVGGALFVTSDAALFGGLDRWWEVAGAGGLGFGLYVLGLALWGEVTKRDVQMAVDIVDPRRMAQYIRSEVSREDQREGRIRARDEKAPPKER